MRSTALATTLQRSHKLLRNAQRRLTASLVSHDRLVPLLTRLGVDTERAKIAARYDTAYYEAGHARISGHTGYGTYDREHSNADHAAYLARSYFSAEVLLDIGCAKGHFVKAARELGLNARGTDLSAAAINMADESIREFLSVGALPEALDRPDSSVDLLTLFETLEHLRPQDVPAALRELRRVSRGYVLATIPSIGRNGSGPDGWCDGKVLESRLEHYRELGPDYNGPIPFADLAVDVEGEPVEGHLTVASYRWWRETFESAGFVTCDRLERFLTYDATRFGLIEFWCTYAFRIPEATEPQEPELELTKRLEIEQNWGLVSETVPQPVLDAAIDRLTAIGVAADGTAID
ncbi:MAG: class I SAM-dependent methyltransferase [Acidimicrobiales bacterium]